MKAIIKYIAAGSFSALILTSCSVISPSGPAINNPGKNSVFHPLGAKLDAAAGTGTSEFSARYGTGSLSTSVDLSTNLWLPPVGDQGLQGSCVAWAAGYYLLTYVTAQASNWTALDQSEEFSPAWIYNQINGGGDYGSLISDAFSLITLKGCDTLADFPYEPSNESACVWQPDASSFLTAAGFEQAGWEYVNMSVTGIEQVLSAGKPVVIGIMVYTPDFDVLSATNDTYCTTNAYTNYTYIISITTNDGSIITDSTNITSFYRGEHALCLVGYDTAKGAFKFVNQWGASYGVSGFGWISFGFVNSVMREAVTFN